MRDRLAKDFGRLDVLVHSIAFANKEDLAGKVLRHVARRLRASRSTSRRTR